MPLSIEPLAMAAPTRFALPAILWGGLLAGLGDYLFAHIFHGWRLGVFQAVAGGLVGLKSARAGGVSMYMLGVALHFFIAIGWATVFWLLSRRLPWLVSRAVPAGLGYGLVVYLGMNCVVLPLSALQSPVRLPALLSWPAAAHALLVGLPIALSVQFWSRRGPQGAGAQR
jgi:hypothetical protein